MINGANPELAKFDSNWANASGHLEITAEH